MGCIRVWLTISAKPLAGANCILVLKCQVIHHFSHVWRKNTKFFIFCRLFSRLFVWTISSRWVYKWANVKSSMVQDLEIFNLQCKKIRNYSHVWNWNQKGFAISALKWLIFAALKYLLSTGSWILKLAWFPWLISMLFLLFTALRDLWSWMLRPLLQWLLLTLKDFWGSYIRASVLVCSPLKHTCAQLCFFFQF